MDKNNKRMKYFYHKEGELFSIIDAFMKFLQWIQLLVAIYSVSWRSSTRV